MGVSEIMKQNNWKLCILITTGISVAAFIYDYRIALGFLLGEAVSILLYIRTVIFCNALLDSKKVRKALVFSRFMSSYALMAIPLILAIVWPDVFNLFAVAAGLLMIKFILVLSSLIERRKSNGQPNSSDNSI